MHRRIGTWIKSWQWMIVALAFMAINLYGVLTLRPGRNADASIAPSPPDAEPHRVEPSVPAADEAAIAPRAEPRPADPVFAVIGVGAQAPSFEDAVLTIRFSQAVRAEELRRKLTLEPPSAFSVAVHHTSWSGYVAQVRGDMRKGAPVRVRIAADLANADRSAMLREAFDRELFIPEARPEIRIRHPGRFLSPAGALRLPVRGINVTGYTLAASRIAPRNLVQYAMREDRQYRQYYGAPDEGIGLPVGRREVALDAARNEVTDATAALRDLLPDDPRGAYVIEVAAEGAGGDRRLVVVTDIGLTVQQSEGALLVWANSLRTLEAAAGARVEVWSPTAALLGEGLTDAMGLAAVALDPNAGEAPFLVTVSQGPDVSFLSLVGARSAPDVEGRRYLAEGFEAFLYTDRGIYRPGETAQVRGLVRGPRLALPPSFPVDLEILRPDGRSHSRQQAMVSAEGTVSFTAPWADFDSTGRYRLRLVTPGGGAELGGGTVLVEDFVPPRLAVDVRGDAPAYHRGDSIRLSVAARYLYGAPAARNRVSARLSAQPAAFRPPAFPDYVFGDGEREMPAISLSMGSGQLDADGRIVFTAAFPEDWRPPAMLRGLLSAEVMEQGGRSVNAFAACELHPYPFYIGIRSGTPGIVQPGDPVRLELALVNPDGHAREEARELEITLDALHWSTVVKPDAQGAARYRSELRRDTVSRHTLATGDQGRERWTLNAAASGAYLVTVQDPESGSATSFRFHVGGGHDRWQSRSMEQPGHVELSLDREVYRPGQTARLSVVAPFAGKALLTVEQDRMLYHAVQEIGVNSAEFDIPVTAELWPNAHVSVRVIRPVAPSDVPEVHRAAGTIPLHLETDPARLRVEISAPESVRPAGRINLDLSVTDSEGQPRQAEFTVAVVDEGICALTAFVTPDPLAFFTALRASGVRATDLYALLMPEIEDGSPSAFRSHTGGDAVALLRGRLNPVRTRRFTPVALWRGPEQTDNEGHARVTFDLPEFSGRLRVMVVASAGARFGSAGTAVTVSRPLTVLSSLPRFLAPGDRCSLAVEVHVAGSGEASGTVEIVTEGSVAVEPSGPVPVRLTEDGRGSAEFVLRAQAAAGRAVVRIRASAGGEQVEERVELPVRPGAARATLHASAVLAPGEQQVVAFPGEWLPGSARYRLQLSGRPEVKLNRALHYLLNYPYGCLEQTVSTSLPLLHLPHLPNADRTFVLGDLSALIESGIRRIVSMQRADGSFSAWPADADADAYAWGTVYALDFLLQAREAGYVAPSDRIDAGLEALRRMLARPARDGGQPGSRAWQADAAVRAYACQVLAQGGQPRPEWTARLLEQAESLDLDTRLRLVLALAAGGQRRDARDALHAWTDVPVSATRVTGGALVSPPRTAALRLMAWLELAPEDARAVEAMRVLETMLDQDRWLSTQDHGVALTALARYMRSLPAEARDVRGRMEQDGVWTMVSPGESGETHDLASASPVTIHNEGPGPLYAAWRASGIPLAMLPSVSEGLDVRREYLTPELQPLPQPAARQGDLMIVRLTVSAGNDPVDNLVIEDLLPAGLEIENPGLRTMRAGLPPGIESTLPVRHVDIRDDRMIVFAGAFSGTRTFHYTVRAVTPGRYAVPHVNAEAMYDPRLFGRSGAGVFTVEAFVP